MHSTDSNSSSANINRLRFWLQTATLLVVFMLTMNAGGQDSQSIDGYEPINPEGLKQIDHIHQALRQAGKISMIVGLALMVIIALKMIAPMSILDAIEKKQLAKATRDVDGLLERIRTDAETASAESEDRSGDEGVLAAMLEATGFETDTEVPAYVLTVNDIMLDGIMSSLTRLRRMRMAQAARYRDTLFTVLCGIKIITEECETTGAASSLAVNSREYYADDARYRQWKYLLSAYAKRGDHQEDAHTFLLFMKNINESKPLTITHPKPATTDVVKALQAETQSDIPEFLREETLPHIQQAAQEEASRLIDLIQKSQPAAGTLSWQFELVRRQKLLQLRDEAKKMLRVYLHNERKALQRITKTKMLPCRTWDHVLYMLGVENTDQLHKRVEMKLLTGQEIIILEKAFLQTFAKRESLQRLYGPDRNAGVMMDLHVPQIRSEALALLRQTHQTEGEDFDDATEFLDEEETPQRHEVAHLIKHFIHHGHLPPGTSSKGMPPSETGDI